jgi:hypothetical protein
MTHSQGKECISAGLMGNCFNRKLANSEIRLGLSPLKNAAERKM